MAGLTTRQQMVKGSVWRALDDVVIEYLNHKSYKNVPSKHGGIETVLDTAQYINIKKGDTITIADKMITYHPVLYDSGLFVRFHTADESNKAIPYIAEFSALSSAFEITQSVQQLIYVMFSPTLGYVSKVPHSGWDAKTKAEYETAQTTGGILFDAKLTKAMKKKRMQDAKQFLLGHSGYYDNIDTSDVYYVFEPGGKKVDMPDDLEIQVIDKATKGVIETASAKAYLDASHRLRPLTEKYGSCVRTLVKDVEKELGSYKSLLLFKDADVDDHYDDGATPAILQLKAEFKGMDFPKDSFKVKSTKGAVVFAFKKKSDAIAFKLTYSGGVQSELLNPETLLEETA